MASLGLVTSLSLFLIDRKLKRKLDAVNYEDVTTTEAVNSSEENAKDGHRSDAGSLHESLLRPST